MPSCPSCRRPVAIARASCLYCGAALPAELTESARAAVRALATPRPAEPDVSRVLVIVDLDAASVAALNELASSAYEKALLSRRGGLQLIRVAAPDEAERERERLLGLGLPVVLVPEALARARPLVARGGALRPEGLGLRTADGELLLAPGALLLIVNGPIVRERQVTAKARRIRTATLEPGFFVHLHRRSDERPIEIDTYDFEPGGETKGSTRLLLESWIAAVAGTARRDDGFRWLTPALGAAETPASGPLAALSSGGSGPVALDRAVDRKRAASAEPLLLDNLEQFRFYSSWRAAALRRRAAQLSGRPD